VYEALSYYFVAGKFMWRMRCPNGSYSLQQWREIQKVRTLIGIGNAASSV
jgi:sulfite reductase beta subunit-like hemoprotein